MTSNSDTLQRGDMISCYQIEEVLGHGGFAVTYLAKDLNLDVHVAIKEYLPREIIQRDESLHVSARRPEFAEDYNIGLSNFAREAKTLARFKHLNIVRVHQVIHKYNTAYIVMDYEHGEELAERLASEQTLSEETLKGILFPIFDGVEEIHRAGLAHRDIKPSNIYLRDNGSPVLLDFGAARYTMSETTQQLTAVVTVGYTPIEQYNVSDNDQGPWSDIYALSAVLYEAVTGEMPVDSVTRASSTLTSASDPLAPVRNKTQQHYSDEFLNAIDWGLRMEAEDRPQSIAQWRDSFNGNFKAAATYVQKKPPGRPSKLKTREKYPPPLEAQQEPPAGYRPDYTVANPTVTHVYNDAEPQIDVDLRKPGYTHPQDDIDDVEIVPLNPSVQLPRRTSPAGKGREEFDPRDHHDNNVTSIQPQPNNQTTDSPASASPISPFASNPAGDSSSNTVMMPPAGTNDSAGPHGLDATPKAITEGRTSHTQELRNVLKRDIMKRDPDDKTRAAPSAGNNNAYPQHNHNDRTDTSFAPRQLNIRTPIRSDNTEPTRRYEEPPHTQRQAEDAIPNRPDIEFDESDWDYEPPTPASKWRWILPATGLMAVVGASLLFVNNPDLFKMPTASGPDMTMDTALASAQQKIENQELIFPAGESALDYYRLIQSTDPDNPEAAAGIDTIETEIKRQILDRINADDLLQANKLLSRANDAGLEIEGLTDGTASQTIEDLQVTTIGNTTTGNHDNISNNPGSNSGSNSGPVAIDTTMSPWVTSQITTIEQLIKENRFTEAGELFRETDKYLSDAEISQSLRNQIEAGKNAVTPAVTEVELPAAVNSNSGLVPIIEPPAVAPLSTGTTFPAEQPDIAEPATLPTEITDVTLQPSVVSAPESTFTAEPQIDTQPEIITPNEPDTTIAFAEQTEPRISAPRQSFIEGSGSTTRHLNQLRQAIEAKNLSQVLRISDSLPEERTAFLRRMFQRYDRLDVTINDINSSENSATARLSVAMFNQRGDGSYYSAGKWSGVTLSTNRQGDDWQKIKW